MSRIEDILAKAERDGRMSRTLGPAPNRAEPQPRPVETRGGWAQTLPAPASEAPVPPPAVQNPVLAPLQTVRQARVSPVLVSALTPHSRAAEQYRAIRTRISQLEGARVCRTLIVTSPLPGDGKTVTAANLAVTMAQESHRRVLVADADLRNGSLHRLFGLPDGPGLSDVLADGLPLEQVMVHLPDCHLTLIPAGSRTDQPTELLGSAAMRRAVDALHTQFDRVVFDTPPTSPLADVGVLAQLVDAVLLVIRAGRTPRPAIDQALEGFDPARLLGLVLNDVEEPQLAHYGATRPPVPVLAEPAERPS